MPNRLMSVNASQYCALPGSELGRSWAKLDQNLGSYPAERNIKLERGEHRQLEKHCM